MKHYILPAIMLALAGYQQSPVNNGDASAGDSIGVGYEPFTRAYSSTEPIEQLSQQLTAFIPKGYELLDTVSGNLNLDDYPDMILVLKKTGEETIEMDFDVPVCRPLIILTGNSGGTYTQAARNDSTVLCYNCSGMFGDAFTGITIKNGYFSTEHSITGGRHWELVTTFKYNKQKADWYLYKEGYISYRMNEDTSADAEALIKDVEQHRSMKDFGVMPFSKYNVYKR